MVYNYYRYRKAIDKPFSPKEVYQNIPEQTLVFDSSGEAIIDFEGEIIKLIIEDVGEFVLYSSFKETDTLDSLAIKSSPIKVKRFYDPKATSMTTRSLQYQESFTLSGLEPKINVLNSYWASPCNVVTIAKYTDNMYNYFTITRSESWWERNYSPVKVKNAYYSTMLSGLNESGTQYDRFHRSSNLEPFGSSLSSVSNIYISTSSLAYSGWNPVRKNNLIETISHSWTADLYWNDTFKKHIIGDGGIWFYGY